MKIVVYESEYKARAWIDELHSSLPSATISSYSDRAMQAADYFICNNPHASICNRAFDIRAVFFLSAGINYYSSLKDTYSCQLLTDVPCYRLEDAGMAEQMMDYATYATLKFYRRFDQYDKHTLWVPLTPYSKADFKVGVLGAGELGSKVAERLSAIGFHVNTWNRSRKALVNVTQFIGNGELENFINSTHLVINLLPLNPQTKGILNKALFENLAKPSYLVNLARGAHVVEDDLVEALARGVLSGAQIDVTHTEPLPSDSALFSQANCFITPHVAAQTLLKESCTQICQKIKRLELNEEVSGQINWRD
jgi:glyoxylate/hydroxypyruvate reductase A